MKIAYFLDQVEIIGGAGIYLLQQARLVAGLHEVIVVASSISPMYSIEEYRRRCELYNLSFCTLEYATTSNFWDIDIVRVKDDSKNIEAFASKEKISLFHSVQLNIAVEYVARKLHIPHIMDIFQLKEEDFSYCPADIHPHYHICDSELYAERWHRMLGIESRCIRPVSILENIKRKTQYPTDDEIRILMLGTMYERKNQFAAIQACEMCMQQHNIILTIAGSIDTPYAEKCIQYVKEKGLEKKIFFTGFVKDVVPLLEKNDCLLCASWDESFPSSIVEAVSYDLCIISTPVAGVPEVFIDGKNSFISKDFTVESIAETIDGYIKSCANGDIRKIHNCAADTWKDNFSGDIVRAQINSFYEYVVGRPYTELDSLESLIDRGKETDKLLSKVYSEYEETYKRTMYHNLIREKLVTGKIYLWGAGKLGGYAYKILRVLCPELEIVAFVDRYKSGQYFDVPIIRPEELPIRDDFYYGICFAYGAEEVIEYLQEKGLVLNKHIWVIQ